MNHNSTAIRHTAMVAFASMLYVALWGTEEAAAKLVSLIIAGVIMISYIIGESMIEKETARSNVTVTVDKSGQTTDDES